jgi:multidrug efflux system outer membrane protein
MRASVSIVALGAALSACATAPAPSSRPALPQTWQAAPISAPVADDAYWRTATQDQVLQRLLTDAGAVSDVAVAQARVREAQALARAARAALFPSLTSEARVQGAGAERGVGLTTSSGSLAVDAPLDPFGASRARTGAAGARTQAALADLSNARLSARRTAGQLYAALRAAQASRAAAERQTRDAEDSLSLARARAGAGLDTGLAVAQAQSAADSARARIPTFAQAETQARLGLEALLGQMPSALTATLAAATAATLEVDRMLAIPAAVMARRPDVRAAEARLAAAGVEGRAAQADRWPTASLSAVLTETAATLFDFGRLKAIAQAANARAEAEAATYQRTIIDALADVETQVDRLLRAREEAAAARAAVASARDQAGLARARYTSGLSSFLEVLLAERNYADAEIALAGADGRVTDAGVSLAAALGLGQDP